MPPRGGVVEGSAGPKIAHFDRVEWVTIPDAGTATAALQTGEVGLLENAPLDLLPVLRRNPDIKVWMAETSGTLPMLRFNHLPPHSTIRRCAARRCRRSCSPISCARSRATIARYGATGIVQRLANRNPPAQGGWNLLITYFPRLDFLNPTVHTVLRANGVGAWNGWPDIPELEVLRDQWMEAPNLAAQKALAEAIQRVAFRTLPHIPLGRFVTPTAHRRTLAGMISGPTAFWNLRREG